MRHMDAGPAWYRFDWRKIMWAFNGLMLALWIGFATFTDQRCVTLGTRSLCVTSTPHTPTVVGFWIVGDLVLGLFWLADSYRSKSEPPGWYPCADGETRWWDGHAWGPTEPRVRSPQSPPPAARTRPPQ
ncbi:MAG TPA: hypothetical protein VNG12_18465 [Acidimicrobiales bacterium]|nr:hypothetical protein [Acidimicrobiales bacterium]